MTKISQNEYIKEEIKSKKTAISNDVANCFALGIITCALACILVQGASLLTLLLIGGITAIVPPVILTPFVLLYYRKDIKEIKNLKKLLKQTKKEEKLPEPEIEKAAAVVESNRQTQTNKSMDGKKVVIKFSAEENRLLKRMLQNKNFVGSLKQEENINVNDLNPYM